LDGLAPLNRPMHDIEPQSSSASLRPCSRRDGRTHLVVVQPTSFCNIDCRYCYVPGRSNRAVVGADVLERILVRIFADAQVAEGFRLVWHNGEPLTLGIDFYRDANAIVRRVNTSNKSFLQCIQTNGTLINTRWVDLFQEFDIAASVSIDGPRKIHDLNRRNRSGRGTHDATMRGVRVLRESGMPLVGLCVVTRASLCCGREIMQFFVDEGFTSLGFIIEEPWGGNPETSFTHPPEYSQSPPLEDQFRRFIAEVFDVWYPYRQRIEIREFHDIFTAFRNLKVDPNSYVQQEDSTPCTVLSFDRNGGVTTFSPQMVAGTTECPNRFIVANIFDIDDLGDLSNAKSHKRLAAEITKGIDRCRTECGYFNLCGGGAPASKFYEHGHFDCTETRECRFSKQLIVDTLLEKISGGNRLGM
jgi:uncharacterized protein